MSTVQTRRRGFPLHRLVIAAIFTSLTAVCAQIILPIGAVPVSLSLLPVLLCGALLPMPDALLAMTAYLLLGLAGVPVFSSFQGGAAKLFGVTGGYILGYLPCAALTRLIIRKPGRRWYVRAAAMGAGVLSCYAFGTAWFMVTKGTALLPSLELCVLPFLPFDAVKIALAVFLSIRLEKPLARA